MQQARAPESPQSRGLIPVLIVAWTGGGAFVVSLAYFLYSYLYRFGLPAADGRDFRGLVRDGAWLPATIDVLLFSLFAVHHTVFARTPLKRWVRSIAPPVLERSIYTWIASLLFIGVCWAWQAVPGDLYRLHGPARFLGYGAQTAGIVLTIFGSRALDVLDLAGIRPVLRARTGAAPAHVPLSTRGVFAIVRHPLYFGWALLVGGAPDMTATRAVFAAISCAYVALAIRWEERGLTEVFGAEYEGYKRRVRWRMLPFVY